MYQRIAHIALVVKDYDEAIDFYTKNWILPFLKTRKLTKRKDG
jgi:catechol 2,3-dioxygenase-like lactoylglutathione lyase family enzyme